MTKISKYSLHVTKKCNMKCTYCYESEDSRDIEITDEEFRNNIDLIMKDENKDIEIEFIGGEPFLEYGRIEFTCVYIALNYRDKLVSYTVTTNGTIYNDKIINIINKFNIKLYISLDGDSESHNINRRFRKNEIESFSIVFKNANKFKKHIVSGRVIIHLTINKSTVDKIYNNIRFLYEVGFDDLSLGFVKKDFNDLFLLILDREMRKVTIYLILCKQYNFGLKVTPITDGEHISDSELLFDKEGATYLEHLISNNKDISTDLQKYYDIINKYHNLYIHL